MHNWPTKTFYGWRVVGATFVVAVFGLGVGFHGPAIYLHALHESRAWPLALISSAVTVHFLVGAMVVANLSALHRRFGIPAVTKAGSFCLAVGVFGWAVAAAPWQLFAATLLSGAGWVTMGVAAVNAIVSPWFVRDRPAALAMAYNGGNIGGVVFSPLWAALIGAIGFPAAAAAIGVAMTLTMWVLADLVFSRTPQQMRLTPDGSAPGASTTPVTLSTARPLPGSELWHDRKFLTLAAAMALGLFAQIGLIVHLYSLLVPALGVSQAGLAMGLVTAMAIVGRSLIGWTMPSGTNRRLVACGSIAVQIMGCVAFTIADGASVPLLLLGVVLFGAGFGNGTWLPPLIAQVEFVTDDVPRVVALIVAISQGAYAFAPMVFGTIRELTPATDASSGAAPSFFIAAGLVQGLAICAFLAGRRR
ncbi:MFS transporter [Bradyrhizobium sp.]